MYNPVILNQNSVLIVQGYVTLIKGKKSSIKKIIHASLYLEFFVNHVKL